jgi:hypothetical protein
MYVQSVSMKFLDAKEFQRGSYSGYVDRLRNEYEKPASSQREKFAAMDALFRTMACELSPRSHGPLWWAPPDELIEKQLAIYFDRGLYSEFILN